jgi:hypothetical protein
MPRKPTGRPPGHPKGARNLSASNSCASCQHPQIERINFLLAKGAAIQPTAAQYGLNHHSLRRHFLTHVSDRFKQLVGTGLFAKFDDLAEKVIDGSAESLDVLDMAIRGHASQWALGLETASDQKMIAHSAQLRQWLKLRADITGELLPAAHATFNVSMLAVDTGYSRTIARIVAAVSPYPEARQAVVAALRELDPQMAITDQREIVAND